MPSVSVRFAASRRAACPALGPAAGHVPTGLSMLNCARETGASPTLPRATPVSQTLGLRIQERHARWWRASGPSSASVLAVKPPSTPAAVPARREASMLPSTAWTLGHRRVPVSRARFRSDGASQARTEEKVSEVAAHAETNSTRVQAHHAAPPAGGSARPTAPPLVVLFGGADAVGGTGDVRGGARRIAIDERRRELVEERFVSS